MKKEISMRTTIREILKLVWKLDRSYFHTLLLAALSGAAGVLLLIYIPRILLDGLNEGWSVLYAIRRVALLLGTRYLLLQLAAWAKRRDDVRRELLTVKVSAAFSEKVLRMDYASLEDPAVLDLKERALFPITNFNAIPFLLYQLMAVLTGAFTLAGILLIMLGFSVVFTGVLIGISAVSLGIAAKGIRLHQTTMEELIPVNRRYGYYVDTAMSADFQKDFRLFQMQPMVERKIEGYVRSINAWFRDLLLQSANLETGQMALASVLRFATWGYAALRTMGAQFGPQISLGEFAVVVGAAERFTGAFQELITAVLSARQGFSILQPFTEFMLWPETQQTGTHRLPGPLEELAFENVRFTYPNTDRLILDGISFSVKRGEKISIVGINNAGKSTVVKLITRLFTPDSGRILWNGEDIQELDYDAYMDRLSAVFQDFQLFPFTIRTNLEQNGEDDEGLYALLEEVDMQKAVKALPDGLDTGLDKSLYEDATDFSGGQKQKLAIARAIHKAADLVILDEPTAALDPLAESEVYEQFHALTRGKTAIFISHRMSSSLFCDRILLLQDGRIAAFDSHENLMKGHNLYRTLFETQAAHYRKAM